MSAFRRSRLLIGFGLMAVLFVGLSAGSADAGGHKGHGHGHRHGHFHHHGHFHGHGFHGHFHAPYVKRVVKPYVYPVLLYDCYGQPYYSWQTSYSRVPLTYFR